MAAAELPEVLGEEPEEDEPAELPPPDPPEPEDPEDDPASEELELPRASLR